MNTCIGEKNKFAFILFAFVQTLQLGFLAKIIFDILPDSVYSRSLMLLWLMVILLTLTLAGMLVFQLFVIVRNITTCRLCLI
jgi:hypothetical protein